jgi:hypothetical protein
VNSVLTDVLVGVLVTVIGGLILWAITSTVTAVGKMLVNGARPIWQAVVDGKPWSEISDPLFVFVVKCLIVFLVGSFAFWLIAFLADVTVLVIVLSH